MIMNMNGHESKRPYNQNPTIMNIVFICVSYEM